MRERLFAAFAPAHGGPGADVQFRSVEARRAADRAGFRQVAARIVDRLSEEIDSGPSRS
jgi:hypothetical protein